MNCRRLQVLGPDLLPADRVLQRWAASVGDGLPMESWEETPKSRMPALDDPTCIVVDQIVMHSPKRVKDMMIPLYKGTGSMTTLRRKLKLDIAGFYCDWRVNLMYFRVQCQKSGNRDLVKMVNVRL